MVERSLADPNIVEFMGAVLHKSHGPLLVYERVQGVNLEDYFQMKKVICLPAAAVRNIWRVRNS